MKISSTLQTFGYLLLLVIMISCKKNKTEPKEEKQQPTNDAAYNSSIIAGVGNAFIQKTFSSNAKSVLTAKIAINQDTLAIYGNTNSASQMDEPHTLVLASNKNKELLITEIFSETLSSRMYMIINQVKSRFVLEVKHYDSETKGLSILDMNHETGVFKTLWSVVVNKTKVITTSSTSRTGKVSAATAGFSDVAMCSTPPPADPLDKKIDETLKYFACGVAAMDAHAMAQLVKEAFESGLEKVKALNEYIAFREQLELTRKAKQRQDDIFDKNNEARWDDLKYTQGELKSDLNELEKLKEKEPFMDKRDISLGLLDEASALNYDEYTGKKIELTIMGADLSPIANPIPLLVDLELLNAETGDLIYRDFKPLNSQSWKANFSFDPTTITDYKKVKGITAQYSYTINGVKKSYTRTITLKFIGPEHITLVSGNAQVGQPGKKLAAPLKVKVLDGKDRALKDAVVEWVVSSGGGTLDATQSLTSAEGIAEMGWTLGSTGTQLVEARVKRNDGIYVSDSPVSFSVGVSIVGRWNLLTRAYQDSTTPLEVENFSGQGYYLDIKADNSYITLFKAENGTGTYTLNSNTIGFKLTSGDDDLTDEGTYTIKKITATELIFEEREAGSVYEIKFSR